MKMSDNKTAKEDNCALFFGINIKNNSKNLTLSLIYWLKNNILLELPWIIIIIVIILQIYNSTLIVTKKNMTFISSRLVVQHNQRAWNAHYIIYYCLIRMALYSLYYTAIFTQLLFIFSFLKKVIH